MTKNPFQEQYKFVYSTLEEHLINGTSWFSVAELSEKLKEKSRKDPSTKMNQYQKEYLEIVKQTPKFSIGKVFERPLGRIFIDFNAFLGDCAGGHRADNREKNRDVLCIPRKMIFLPQKKS